jgi:hypothetical protein
LPKPLGTSTLLWQRFYAEETSECIVVIRRCLRCWAKQSKAGIRGLLLRRLLHIWQWRWIYLLLHRLLHRSLLLQRLLLFEFFQTGKYFLRIFFSLNVEAARILLPSRITHHRT